MEKFLTNEQISLNKKLESSQNRIAKFTERLIVT